MMLPLLLLLSLLGPGSCLQPRKAQEDGSVEAPGHLLTRGRRQVPMTESLEGDWDDDDDNATYSTDPPESFYDSLETTAPTLKLLATMGGPAGPRTPEPAASEVPTGASAGGPAARNESGALTTQGVTVTPGPMPGDPATSGPPHMEAPSPAPITLQALSSRPVITEALNTLPGTTEVLFAEPTHTEALPAVPVATEALSTAESTAMQAPSTAPAAIETLSTELATMAAPATEAPATEAPATEAPATTAPATAAPATTAPATTAPATEPATTQAPSAGPATAKPLPTGPATPRATSDLSGSFIDKWRNQQSLFPKVTVAPSPTRAQDFIPVKQCLLAILILALVATVFLVCTVVLAVRLSRKSHMYPVRNYSPTEMVCISSLLPDGGEGSAAATANGGLPHAKSRDQKAEPGEDREGDDLTLHSFLP
ncbi:P-selectin glycoprotein ligand 1 [Galemys pyrenaicus]|uniref:P-selectin glycoprotein ligand 1 n=1 Tax=Galemys pyrenaicus TaxID=202257 RepID=A0A8J6AP27_GALPY|nr:P-selectin glycoprotein ligand 1 [Galemys pyrenaicus]